MNTYAITELVNDYADGEEASDQLITLMQSERRNRIMIGNIKELIKSEIPKLMADDLKILLLLEQIAGIIEYS